MLTQLLPIALTLATYAAGDFAKTTWGPNGSDKHTTNPITTFSTTLEVPPLPSSQGFFLWPGLYTGGDFVVQSLITNDNEYLPFYCNASATTNAWCAMSWAYSGTASVSHGKATLVKPGDMIDIKYAWDGADQNYTQTMQLQGSAALLSSLSWSVGPGYRMDDTIECHGLEGSASPEHKYHNTTFVLERPNLSFNSTLSHVGSTPSTLSSADGGKTWTVPTVVMGADTCGDSMNA